MSTEGNGTPRTIIYTRVAREQDSLETPEAQRVAVEAYAEAHGYEMVPAREAEDAPEAGLIITNAAPVTESEG